MVCCGHFENSNTPTADSSLPVAITRAKALLIVVGDARVLSLDPIWRKFLSYAHSNKGWEGPDPEWDTSDADGDAGYDAEEEAKREMDELVERFGLALSTEDAEEAIGEDDEEEDLLVQVDKPDNADRE